MEEITLNEIELKLFLLKNRTRKAIERNEASMSRLNRSNQARDAFIASLEGRPPPILEDDSLYNTSLGLTSTEHSDPEPYLEDSSAGTSSGLVCSTIDERDDANSSGLLAGSSAEDERHGVEQNSSSSLESSVSTTTSSTASRTGAFLEMATREQSILARLDRLRGNHSPPK